LLHLIKRIIHPDDDSTFGELLLLGTTIIIEQFSQGVYIIRWDFNELAKLHGFTSCFVVTVAVAVVVAGLLVLYSMMQVENLPLQQGSHARMQFGILSLQQGNSRRVHAVWYPATAVWYPATTFWYPATAVWYPATAV
jgi:hypothetical protein